MNSSFFELSERDQIDHLLLPDEETTKVSHELGYSSCAIYYRPSSERHRFLRRTVWSGYVKDKAGIYPFRLTLRHNKEEKNVVRNQNLVSTFSLPLIIDIGSRRMNINMLETKTSKQNTFFVCSHVIKPYRRLPMSSLTRS